MLQSFNPNLHIMSGAKANPFTFKQLKGKQPNEFIHVSMSTYPSYRKKDSGGQGAKLNITFKDADGNDTGRPFEITTPPVNIYFPNFKGTHQGRLAAWDEGKGHPLIEDAKRRVKFQVGEMYGKVKEALSETKNVDKLLQYHTEWYDFTVNCLDEIANQIHAMATNKEFRSNVKDQNINEGIVADLIKEVKAKTGLESFKDNFKAGLEWDEKSDKNGNNLGRIMECWSKVQRSKGRPSVQYPIVTKKLVDEEFTVVRNVTPSDEKVAEIFKWDTEAKNYSYHGNELDEKGQTIEPDLIKHNQVASVVFQPMFYARPIRGIKLVLKKIQILQEPPAGQKRKRDDDLDIEDDWGEE